LEIENYTKSSVAVNISLMASVVLSKNKLFKEFNTDAGILPLFSI